MDLQQDCVSVDHSPVSHVIVPEMSGVNSEDDIVQHPQTLEPPCDSSWLMDDDFEDASRAPPPSNPCNSSSAEERRSKTRCKLLKYVHDRFRGLRDIPRVVVFGIVLMSGVPVTGDSEDDIARDQRLTEGNNKAETDAKVHATESEDDAIVTPPTDRGFGAVVTTPLDRVCEPVAEMAEVTTPLDCDFDAVVTTPLDRGFDGRWWMEDNSEAEIEALLHATEDMVDAVEQQQCCVFVDHRPDSPVIVVQVESMVTTPLDRGWTEVIPLDVDATPLEEVEREVMADVITVLDRGRTELVQKEAMVSTPLDRGWTEEIPLEVVEEVSAMVSTPLDRGWTEEIPLEVVEEVSAMVTTPLDRGRMEVIPLDVDATPLEEVESETRVLADVITVLDRGRTEVSAMVTTPLDRGWTEVVQEEAMVSTPLDRGWNEEIPLEVVEEVSAMVITPLDRGRTEVVPEEAADAKVTTLLDRGWKEENNKAETEALLHATEDMVNAVEQQQHCVFVNHIPDSHVIVPEMSGGFVTDNSVGDIVQHAPALELPSDRSRLMHDDYDDVNGAAPTITRSDLVRYEPSTDSHRLTAGDSEDEMLQTRLEPPSDTSCPMDDGSPSVAPSSSTKERRGNTLCKRLKSVNDRFRGLLDIPRVLVFGIILYLMDVSSDITAGIHHFGAGHPVWGSLTITFVVLPALCWAAVSWTWWYYHPIATHPTATTERKEMRRYRMRLAILLLDPLVT